MQSANDRVRTTHAWQFPDPEFSARPDAAKKLDLLSPRPTTSTQYPRCGASGRGRVGRRLDQPRGHGHKRSPPNAQLFPSRQAFTRPTRRSFLRDARPLQPASAPVPRGCLALLQDGIEVRVDQGAEETEGPDRNAQGPGFRKNGGKDKDGFDKFFFFCFFPVNPKMADVLIMVRSELRPGKARNHTRKQRPISPPDPS